ncbi:MAG: protein kinase [Tannerella sp.]|jgi:serine/threonine-protein kinase|nr:protein kinase [Tannerella sp.]
MNLPAGYLLQNGKYQLRKVIGQGGFGITYEGILTEVRGKLGTIKSAVPICIKEYFFKDYCYRAEDNSVQVHSETGRLLFGKFKEKMLREARILSEVHHPYIVNVLDVFEENNTAYIAMEYIEGNSLKYLLERDGRFPETRALKYIRQVGEALQFVHEKNILHLDVKPGNILIDRKDNARLIDFGVSKRYDTANRETSTTMLTLSKGFASIEQYDNEGTFTFSPCPDVYSLGATLYNLLTGQIPTESILRATRPMARPSEINPLISAKTEAAILKAMQINPADRFQSVKELLLALDLPAEIQEEAAKDEDDTTLIYRQKAIDGNNDAEQTILQEQPPRKRRGRHNLLVAFLCAFVLVGAAFAYHLVGNHTEATPIVLPTPPEIKTAVKDKSTAKDEKAVRRDVARSSQKEEKQSEQGKEKDLAKANDKPAEVTRQQGDSLHLAEVSPQQEYETLITQGKARMNAGKYAEASEDFNKAMDINGTEEVRQLMIANALKLEAKQTEERIAQYEDKMALGKLRIVRKKSTGKYGAINDKGEEIIPCKYNYVDMAGEGTWAFERADKLFDIYNSKGVLVRTDSTYY